MLTHRNNIFNLLAYDAVQKNLTGKVGPDGHGDCVLGVLPYFHVFGLTLVMTHPLMIGYKVVIMPAFDIEAFCGAIQEHKATFLHVVPPIILALSKSPVVDKYDLSSVKMAVCGMLI